MKLHGFPYIGLLSGGEEPSLLKELWEYLKGKYFSVDTGRYENLNIGSGSLITAQNVVLGIAGGIVVAAGMACYDRNRLGAFVRAIVREQCLWPEKAKTLSELGFFKNAGVKASLRSPNKLGRVVRCVEKEAYEQSVVQAEAEYAEAHEGSTVGFYMPAYRINFETDHFYIPDEEHYRAEIRFDNRGSSLRAFLLVLVLAVVGAGAVCFLMPDILQLMDNLMGILTESDKFLH